MTPHEEMRPKYGTSGWFSTKRDAEREMKKKKMDDVAVDIVPAATRINDR